MQNTGRQTPIEQLPKEVLAAALRLRTMVDAKETSLTDTGRPVTDGERRLASHMYDPMITRARKALETAAATQGIAPDSAQFADLLQNVDLKFSGTELATRDPNVTVGDNAAHIAHLRTQAGASAGR